MDIDPLPDVVLDRVKRGPGFELDRVETGPGFENQVAHPRASSPDTGDSTNDISFTISKDSSADERVRNAKLLADMGERNQRHRGGNDALRDSGVIPASDFSAPTSPVQARNHAGLTAEMAREEYRKSGAMTLG
jgi:hypothetical protein